MASQFVTVSEAARTVGVTRRTVQRWLAARCDIRRKAGKVALSDVRRCVRQSRGGRPCGSGVLNEYARSLKRREATGHYSEAHRLIARFIGTEGERRFFEVLRALAVEWAARKNAKKLAKMIVGFAADLHQRAVRERTYVERQAREKQRWAEEKERERQRRKLAARARQGDAAAARELRELAIVIMISGESVVYGENERQNAVEYYRKHLDSMGRLPDDVPMYSHVLGKEHLRKERIAAAGKNRTLEAIPE
jgi:hypothetical protein